MPLLLRNRMAELIREALHDGQARAGLAALAAVCDDPHALDGRPSPDAFPADLFERWAGGLAVRHDLRAHERDLCDRARRGWAALRERPLDPPEASLPVALAAAAALFDAGLYFEVHEQLEPHWLRARGHDRETLQGLIQIAVGFQHLANGNAAGARALLRDGGAKFATPALAGRDLRAFARAVGQCGERVAALGDEAPARFPWESVPPFPSGA